MKSFAIVSSENNNITLSNGNETNSKKISQGYQMLGTYLTISNSGNVTNFCLHTKPGRKQHTRYRHLEMSRRSYSYSIKTGLRNPVCIRYTVGGLTCHKYPFYPSRFQVADPPQSRSSALQAVLQYLWSPSIKIPAEQPTLNAPSRASISHD